MPARRPCVLALRALALAVVLACATAARAEAPLTLDQALALAHQANVRLPLSVLDVASADAALRAARAQRWVRGSVEGSLVYAPPGAGSAYADNADEYLLQLVARQPLYAGGALSAQIRGSDARLDAARARLRGAEKDLALAVTSRYFEILKTLDELAFRHQGLDRLRAYSVSIRDRLAAGQGVQSDLLRTNVRIEGDEADVADAERRLALARLELNELLGRDPTAPLQLAPPPPAPPPARMPTSNAPWLVAPELAEGRADAAAARADVAVTRAERRPHLDLVAQGGLWQTGQSQTSGSVAQQLRAWAGYSFGLTLSWSIFDFGIYRAHLAQARLAARQAEIGQNLLLREARLQWDRARASLDNLDRELAVRTRAVPDARDSYLLAESLYRGGAATALEVLDAYASWISAEEAAVNVLYDVRVAAATLQRWGTR